MATTELTAARTAISLPPERARELGKRQLAWAAWVTALSGWLALVGISSARPDLALALALGVGVIGVRPRKFLAAPLVLGALLLAALAAGWAGLSPALAAGAAAGWLLVRLEDREKDRTDYLHGVLAGAAAAGIGVWAGDQLLPAWIPTELSPLFKGAVFGLISAQTLLPLSIVWRHRADLPSERTIYLTLSDAYREAPLRAHRLFTQLQGAHSDKDTLEGLEEVACWIYRLSLSLQTLDRELGAINPSEIQERIVMLTSQAASSDDAFTRERRLATTEHLEQMLAHTERLKIERERLASLQEYASAYLEEAKMGSILARRLPGESAPGRLDDVLGRLREHAKEGESRRKMARELSAIRAL